jgi:hypothetical protein
MKNPTIDLSRQKQIEYKTTLRYFILAIIISVAIANSIIIFSNSHNKRSSTLVILNMTAAIASSLGIIAICRHGLHGLHGKSYLFLTIGLIFWFSADVSLAYSYFALGIEEQIRISATDLLWFAGYAFLALHLFAVLRFIRSKINLIAVAVTSIAITSFISYNVFYIISSSKFFVDGDFVDFVATLAYPILDLILIVPSLLVLINLRKDYMQSIPWLLSSLSLLVNAIADDGYANDFVNAHLHNLLFWDMFYVSDFIIMAGALFWYNRFHIQYEKRKMRAGNQ